MHSFEDIDKSLIGLISSTADGDSTSIELIRSLAEEYARNENCIILLTVSCESAYLVTRTLNADDDSDGG